MDENLKLAQQAVDKGYVKTTEEYLNAERRAKPVSSIPATDIQGTNPVTVPTPPTSTSTIDQIASENQLKTQQAQKEFDTSKTTFQDRINEIAGVMGSREALEKEAGLDQAQLDVSDIRSQIEAREMAYRRAVENTQKTAGLSGTQISRQVSALSRDASRELADLSIIESARLRRFDSISTNIDRKIKSQLEPLQFQLQFDEMFYKENFQILTAQQKQDFEIKMLKENRNYQEQLQEKQDIKRIAEMAYQYGATGEQVTKITDATTWAEAMEAGGTFLGEPFRLQVEAQKFAQQIQREQLNISYAQLDIQKKEYQAKVDAVNFAKENGILTEDQSKVATELRKEVNNLQEVKATKELEPNIVALLSALEKGNGVGDIAAINSFQRLAVDPGVAVREGDVALLQSAQSFGDQAFLKAKGLFKGNKLTDEARKQMKELALDIYQARVDFTNENIQPIKTTAIEQGIDYDKYVGKQFSTKQEVQSKVGLSKITQEETSYLSNLFNKTKTNPVFTPNIFFK
jgi:hypothetical protein